MRRAHFDVQGGDYDGQATASVVIESSPVAGFMIRVRPYRRQQEAVMLLSDVAEIVLQREAKLLARERQR